MGICRGPVHGVTTGFHMDESQVSSLSVLEYTRKGKVVGIQGFVVIGEFGNAGRDIFVVGCSFDELVQQAKESIDLGVFGIQIAKASFNIAEGGSEIFLVLVVGRSCGGLVERGRGHFVVW